MQNWIIKSRMRLERFRIATFKGSRAAVRRQHRRDCQEFRVWAGGRSSGRHGSDEAFAEDHGKL
ncbi:hypothetical protein, partial [Novosphingobium sp. PhB57]|uniref:hypothetical protein n=1 Tax=Novosphingobium sp. PhB57 TaxID=2485107 RepID=UPI001A9DD43B